MGFFAFLPILGTALSIALGLMRANPYITAVSTLMGKFLRYVLVLFLGATLF